ncbi:MAG: alcohol dehydrogenase catalytic domain-containing protein [Gammaproteobacteria bacterium]|nr:alcohol dehydrogenase catalytic domain-containing protein [Gammaproteobacteria bacterium]
MAIRQFASGICHSQLHQMHQPRQQPVILGHESTGVVVQSGSEVSHVSAGDMVMVTWVRRDVRNSSRVPEATTNALQAGEIAGRSIIVY